MCEYCSIETKGFTMINTTSDYSFIEVSVSSMGYIRCRAYYDNDCNIPPTQEIVEIKYCPMCGRKII